MAQLINHEYKSETCILAYRNAIGFSPMSEQVEDLKAYASKKQFREVGLLDLSKEKGVAAKDQLLEYCKGKGATILICWRMDCLGDFVSDYFDLSSLIVLLLEAGIKFLVLKDSIDSSTNTLPFLKGTLRAWDQMKKNKKIEIARASAIKAKQRGSHLGKLKIRNDRAIQELRNKGLSLREIAFRTGVSTSAVQRALRIENDPGHREPESHT